MYNDDTSSTVSESNKSQPPVPETKEPRRQSRAFKVVSVLLILALLGAGAMAYMWYSAAQSEEEASLKVEQLSEENDRLKVESGAQTDNPDQAVQKNSSASSSQDSRVALEKTLAATAKLEVKKPGEAPNRYAVTQFDNNFAIVALGSGNGAAKSIYKEVDGLWFGVWVGQNAVSRCVGERFGLPEGYYDKTVVYQGESC